MIGPTRGIARAARLQWRSASSSSKAARQAKAAAPSPAKPLPTRVTKSYKPNSYAPPKQPQPNTSSSSSPPPPEADTLLSLWRTTWLPLTGAALLAGGLGFYILGTAAATFKGCPCQEQHDESAAPTGRPPALTGDNAEQFDKELDLPEWWMGITKLRKKIAEHAKGDVLELAMGTGRNMEYYNWAPLSTAVERAQARDSNPQKPIAAGVGVTSFTGLDISVDMLDVARKRLVKTVPPLSSMAPIVKASTMADHTGGQLSFLDGQLRLIHSDAHHPLPTPKSRAKYDTVVQSFGLCSVSDPVAVLSNLATVVKPDTGRIILLEHGKGWYGIVNGLLDKNAGKHFDKYGCWWNRDIEALVDEAVAKTPGLQVVKIERPNILQMGTLVWVELRMTETP